MCIRDRYLALADQAGAAIDRVDANIDAQLDALRLGAVAVLVLLALSQLAPLYLGWELLTGRRDPTRRVPITKGTAAGDAPTAVIAAPTTTVIAPLPAPVTTTLPEEEWSPIAPPEDRGTL